MAGGEGGFDGLIGGLPESRGVRYGVVSRGFRGGGGNGFVTGWRFGGAGLFELAVEGADLANKFSGGSFEGAGGAEFGRNVAFFLRQESGEAVPLAMEFSGLSLLRFDGEAGS